MVTRADNYEREDVEGMKELSLLFASMQQEDDKKCSTSSLLMVEFCPL